METVCRVIVKNIRRRLWTNPLEAYYLRKALVGTSEVLCIRPPSAAVYPVVMTLAETDFAALAVEHFDALYGLARRLSGDPSRAEDLVQETYLRALRARESFRLEEFGIRPWLMRILHNLHVTRATRESRQPKAIDGELLERVSGESTFAPVPRSFVPDDIEQELLWAIEALPESYRAVLLLWAVEQKSYAEIAVALSLPPGTVMSRLHRARKQICEQLGRPLSPRTPVC